MADSHKVVGFLITFLYLSCQRRHGGRRRQKGLSDVERNEKKWFYLNVEQCFPAPAAVLRCCCWWGCDTSWGPWCGPVHITHQTHIIDHRCCWLPWLPCLSVPSVVPSAACFLWVSSLHRPSAFPKRPSSHLPPSATLLLHPLLLLIQSLSLCLFVYRSTPFCRASFSFPSSPQSIGVSLGDTCRWGRRLMHLEVIKEKQWIKFEPSKCLLRIWAPLLACGFHE